ncbi:glycosyltransferase family 4 protein [Shewanella algae]|uniref:glycosyltransferase family 4 protein n=1 Tax=Shewanella algae TaxID=38313 RepID=UPI0031F59ED1
MKVKYISSSILPSRFANSVHVMKMCNAFSKVSDVELFAVEGDNFGDIYKIYSVGRNFSVRTFRKGKSRLSSLAYVFKVFAAIKREPDTVVYGRHLLSLLILSLKRMPLVYEAHSLPTSSMRTGLEKLLFRLPNFEKLVVISEALKKDYLSEISVLGCKDILVAHDGADIPSDITTKTDRTARLKVGYIGQLYQGRGINLIIDIAKSMPKIDFVIIGGMENDISYWKSQTINLTNIDFKGHMSQRELSLYYSEIDVLLAPYQNGANQFDGKADTSKWMSPMKIFEYMSYNKPIVCSDILVLREILNESNACLVAPDKVEEWISAIRKLEEDSGFREFIATNAYQDFINCYTWDERAKTILDNIFI